MSNLVGENIDGNQESTANPNSSSKETDFVRTSCPSFTFGLTSEVCVLSSERRRSMALKRSLGISSKCLRASKEWSKRKTFKEEEREEKKNEGINKEEDADSGGIGSRRLSLLSETMSLPLLQGRPPPPWLEDPRSLLQWPLFVTCPSSGRGGEGRP